MATNRSYERLSVEDELFVHLDARRLPMTIALLAIFDEPKAGFEGILAAVNSRLHLVPRFRKKLMSEPFASGRTVWVDDVDFDLRFHVHHVGLPAPGGWQQLLDLAARIFSSPLDLSRPLWEMWSIDLPDGRMAMFQKAHHSMADGVSAIDIASILFDATPEPADTGPVPEWTPQPPPSTLTLIRDRVIDDATAPLRAAERFFRAAEHPRQLADRAAKRAHGVESFLHRSLPPTSSTSLDRRVHDPYRILETVKGDLADVKALKKRCGATVNDLVLSAAAAGIGSLLRSRGEKTDGLIVRTVIPVSTRTVDQHYTWGNMIAAMTAELPVGERDPWKRLELVQHCTTHAKETGQSLGIDFVAQMGTFAPSSLVAVAARIAQRQPMYSLVVTNVPGPRKALYFGGAELREAYFFGPNLIHTTDLAVAVLSYNGQLNFGLTADRAAVPDIAKVAEGIAEALDEIKQA